MSFEEDPEVIADLQFRASSQYDSSRTRTANYTWTSPKTVAMWKCKVPACGGVVEVAQDAIDAIETFNRMLKARGEVPIATSQIVYCERCRSEFQRGAPDRRRGQVDRMADVIKQPRDGVTQMRVKDKNGHSILAERAALKQPAKWGHPDITGLEQALQERRSSGKGGKRGKL